MLLGSKRVEQLDDDAGAVDIELTPDELHALDEVSQLPADYPKWMLDMWGQSRVKESADART